MIAHVSIPARDPRATAVLLATLMDGVAFPFPVVPEAWIAVASDGSGQAIEIYPDTMAHHPGKGQVDPSATPKGPETMPWEDQIFPDGPQIRPSAFHFAMSTPLDDADVIRLAQNAGFRALRCDRAGIFGLVELWLDNSFLIEVLSRPQVERYRRFMNPEEAAKFFGPGIRPQLQS